MDLEKYNSRKLGVTLLVIGCTTVLAYVGKMDAHVGLVFGAAIGSYNFMQGWIDKVKAGK